MARPMPTALSFPSGMVRIGYFSSQRIISRTFLRHWSSVQEVLTEPS